MGLRSCSQTPVEPQEGNSSAPAASETHRVPILWPILMILGLPHLGFLPFDCQSEAFFRWILGLGVCVKASWVVPEACGPSSERRGCGPPPTWAASRRPYSGPGLVPEDAYPERISWTSAARSVVRCRRAALALRGASPPSPGPGPFPQSGGPAAAGNGDPSYWPGTGHG